MQLTDHSTRMKQPVLRALPVNTGRQLRLTTIFDIVNGFSEIEAGNPVYVLPWRGTPRGTV
jgi:hypothetical protein